MADAGVDGATVSPGRSTRPGLWRARAVRTTLVGLLVGLVVGALVVGFAATRLIPRGPVVGATTQTSDDRIVDAVTREEQVVLLSLGIQGIATRETHSTIFGAEVPGTGRAIFLQYSYRAKLGLDGSGVRVERRGDHTINISLPPFLVIGHQDEKFETVVEKNGVISVVTPEIDTAKLISELLSDEALNEQLNQNRTLLEDQARAYYTGIVHGVDKDLNVQLEFRRT